jgi:APA family basic amino acid/polyamine antiporter
MLPGDVVLVGTVYAFAATLSFTVAHAAIVRLRLRDGADATIFRAWPSVRAGGVRWPAFALVGGLGTGISCAVVVAQHETTRWVALAWLLGGFGVYAVHRRRIGEALTATVRAPMRFGPSVALEFRTIVVPVVAGAEAEEALDVAARLAADRRARLIALRVIVVPLALPMDAELPDEEAEADRLLDEARAVGAAYGVRVLERVVRARNAGRAIVDEAARRNAEIVVMGAPRRWRPERRIFGKTIDFVMKNAPCRVMVAAGKRVA